MACLDISLTRCMQALSSASPIALRNTNDHEILEILKRFERRLHRSRKEIEQACNLALGSTDLVVILERPAPKQNYSVSFEQFVIDCKILKAVNDLIKFATKNARSIYIVIVLNVFSFKSFKDQVVLFDEECQNLIAKIIELKRSRMLLCC